MGPLRTLAAIAAFAVLAVGVLQSSQAPQSGSAPPSQLPKTPAAEVQQLKARTLRVFQAPEASQGVAADLQYFYAVDNSVLAKYAIHSGRLIERWTAPNGVIRHMNSCLADGTRIRCANSNYPQTPRARRQHHADRRSSTS